MKRIFIFLIFFIFSAAFITALVPVTFAAVDGLITIKGEAEFKKSPYAETTYSNVKAKYDGADAEFVYSLAEPVTGVYIEQLSGRFFVSPEASVNQDIVIKAALMSDLMCYNTFTVRIVEPIYHSFEDGTHSWKAQTTGSPANLVATDSSNNKYLEPSGNRVNSPWFGISSSVGSATVEFRTMYTSGGAISFGSVDAPDYTKPNWIDNGKWYFDLNVRRSGSNAIYSSNSKSLITIPRNTWMSVKIMINFEDEYFDIYMNGAPVSLNFKFDRTYNNFRLNNIFAYGPLDDLRIYSGVTTEINKTKEFLLIPPVGRFANVELSHIDSNISPVWGLAESYKGVSINPVTGVLTVTGEAKPQDIKIKATVENRDIIYKYPLKKYSTNSRYPLNGRYIAEIQDGIAVIDANNQVYTPILNGILDVEQINLPLEGNLSDIVYDIGTVPPYISIPVIDELIIGEELSCTYEYFSELDLAENCTHTEWFISDDKDGSYQSLGSTHILSRNDLGKFIKVMVVPRSIGDLVGAPVYSEPVFTGGYNITGLIANGNPVTDLTVNNFIVGQNTLDVALNYANSADYEVQAEVFAAFYNGSKLESVSTDGKPIQKNRNGELFVTLSFEITDYSEKTVKLFIWDGKKLSPISDPIIIK